MNAETLMTLARAADNVAERMERRRSTSGHSYAAAQPLRIAADRARSEAIAANGMGTEAGLMWSICVQNDRATAETIAAMVTEHAESETARADLADALRDWTENTAGTEGVAVERHGEVVGKIGGRFDLSPLMLTLIRSAIVAIDWHALAVCLLDEHALQKANAECPGHSDDVDCERDPYNPCAACRERGEASS